jgi:hypothetical protein
MPLVYEVLQVMSLKVLKEAGLGVILPVPKKSQPLLGIIRF